jgi:hypothetical protein
MTVSLPSRQPAGYCDIPSPFALDDEAFRALGHPLVDTLGAYLEALPESAVYEPLPDEVCRQIEEPISLRGAERPAQDRRAEELECAI